MLNHSPARIFLEGDDAGAYLPQALKVLSTLVDEALQRGVDTLSTVVNFGDGVTVRAQVAGDVHQIQISSAGKKPPVPCLGCTVYLESGVLDLGVNSNTAVTGQPIVDSSVPTLRFGDTSLCSLGPQGNTTFAYCDDNTASIGGGCQFDSSGIESTACNQVLDKTTGDPVVTFDDKKKCQSILQPSLWTGLMHRWVQAMYGNPKAVYKSTTITDVTTGIVIPHLMVRNSADTHWLDIYYCLYNGTSSDDIISGLSRAGTFGLIDITGKCNYYFVLARHTDVVFFRGVLTPCGQRIAKIVSKLKPTATTPAKQRHCDIIEAFLFTQLSIDDSAPFSVSFDVAVEEYPLCYGWKFNPRAPEMAMVTVADASVPQATLRKRAFGFDTDGTTIVITNHDLPSENLSLFSGLWNVIAIPYLDNRSTVNGNSKGFTGSFISNTISGPVADFDAPIYCWYLDNGTLEVVRSSFTDGGSSSYTPSACWPDYNETSNFPNLSESCDINNPCLFSSPTTAHAATMGFYTARASNVGLTYYGKTGSTFNNYDANVQGVEYAATWDTADRGPFTFFTSSDATQTMTGSVGVPGNSYTWSFDWRGCVVTGDGTSAHGCPKFTASVTVDTLHQATVTVSCPDGSFPSTSTLHTDITIHPQLGLFDRKSANWVTYDILSPILIIPAGSASAAMLVTATANTFSGTSAESTYSYICAASISDALISGPWTCGSGSPTVTTSNPPNTHSAPNGQNCSSTLNKGWLVDGTISGYGQVFPELHPPGPNTVGGGGGSYGIESISGKLLGFAAGTVITLPSASGSTSSDTAGHTGTFSSYKPSCMPVASVTYETESNDPMMTLSMTTGADWPADANDIAGFLIGGDAADIITNGSFSKPAMFVHTSVGGATMYFKDFPELKPALADNNLGTDKSYVVIERPSFVGWA